MCSIRSTHSLSNFYFKSGRITSLLSQISLYSTMKGILVTEFGGPDKLTVVNNLEKPAVKDSDVLINIKSHGVNPVDTYLRAGVYPKLPSLPYTPGKDGAGIVDAVGKSVKNFKVGDRVYCTYNGQKGTLAQYSSIDESFVFHLPERCSFDEGAALPLPFFTAYRALFITSGMGDLSNKSVFIHGASGSVGQACIQLALLQGAKVSGSASTSSGLDAIKHLGAHAAYDHSSNGYVDQIKKNEQGFDLIIEMLANKNLQADIELLKPRGTVVIVGCRGEIQINPRVLMAPETKIIGCALANTTPEEFKKMGAALFKGIQEGKLKPRIAKVYSLNEVGQAHDDVIQQKGLNGKLVVRIDS